ncbi:MBL fold metallo-hydrolase [Mammaliicoccus vitulinus]|uniref:MBL fold metallo-hydrolase n=1 Tax=Mammaliicoccus vitulinus TaxID=71237 RepID=UPI003B9EE00B
MKINHIRNATSIIEYANNRFLIDPMLGEKGSFGAFPNAPRQDQDNPIVDLPMSLDEITNNIDAIILTHLHADHFDEVAQQVLNKNIQVFVQNEDEADQIRNVGFKNVEVLTEYTTFNDIKLIKTLGKHGRGEIVEAMGPVCGVIFEHESEQKLYIAGDTVWYSKIKETINHYQPEIIIVNGGDNQFYDGSSLIMNGYDIYQVSKEAPNSKIIVVHMEAVNHWNLSRDRLKELSTELNMDSQVLVPDDGDSYNFNKES